MRGRRSCEITILFHTTWLYQIQAKIFRIFISYLSHLSFMICLQFSFFFENEFPFKIDLDGIHDSLNISKDFIRSPFSLNYFGAKFVTNRLGFFIVQLNSFFNSFFCIIKIVPEINSGSVFGSVIIV